MSINSAVTDEWASFALLIVGAEQPAILCHPDKREMARRFSDFFRPLRVPVMEDPYCAPQTIAAVDLGKLKPRYHLTS